MARRLLLALVLSFLGGCANFKVVSEFAQQTSRVTSTVRTEFGQVDTLCREQAELNIVVNNISDDGPLVECREYVASNGVLASVTLDVLDDYAQALDALANNASFDLSSDIDTIAGKVQGLRSREGGSLVSAEEVTAISKVVQLLADIATQARREAAVRRMVQEKQSLATIGKILRSYFVADPSAPPGRRRPPYVNLLSSVTRGNDSALNTLARPAFFNAEPIRTVELRRASARRVDQLKLRAGSGPDKLPFVVADAIDAWLAALDAFSEDALKPDPKDLLSRLKDLRAKATAAKAAVEAAANK